MLRLATAILLLLISSAGASAQTHQHQHGSSPSGDGNFNPFVTSDGRGGFYLTYICRANGSSDVMLRHSADGRVFSDPVRVNDREADAAVRNENPPKVAVSAGGEVYVCWSNERAKWKGDIRFARSTDGGKSFSKAITLNSDAAGEPTGHAFQSVAIDKRGRVYVAWIDERNKRAGDRGAEIWMSVSDDGGKTFSRDRKILADVCECCRTNIQIDGGGRLFLAYRTVPATGPMYRDIIVARSVDGGKSFTPVRVSADKWEINACPVTGPGLSIGRDGRITVVWFTGGDRQGLYYATSGDHGSAYSPSALIDTSRNLGKHAQALALPDGRVFIAWDEKADKMQIVRGVLDLSKGVLKKYLVKEESSYPTIAFGGRTVVIAGMDGASHDILLQPEFIDEITRAGPNE
ncbi:MAG TPA: sialidase family protein [Blastocatellia bacterium]|nr:sialidase family protein [Blastocatellia bacterium]